MPFQSLCLHGMHISLIMQKVEELSKQNKTEDAVKLVLGPARNQYVECAQQLQIIIDVNNKGSQASAINAEEAYANRKLLSISLIIAAILATNGNFYAHHSWCYEATR